VLIEILTAGSREHGFGHIKRSSVLAGYLSNSGHDVSQRDLTDSISNTEQFLDMRYVPCRILDLPPKLEKLIDGRVGSQGALVSLDGVKIQSDLNFTIYRHSNSKSIQNLVGYEYAIISDDFLKHRGHTRVSTNDFRNVCVCLGGGDVLGQGPMISKALHSRGFDVTLICGPYVDYKTDYDTLPVKVVREPENIAEIFHKSDWIVSNAGGTLFEALCMGKPVVSCPQTAEEELIGQDLLNRGALLGLGFESAVSPDFSISNQAIELAMKTVDGLGKSRIKLMIEEALNFA
jgi:spore coat polysaccharide biosynthesis predicted glycosyltransferase SpsG